MTPTTHRGRFLYQVAAAGRGERLRMMDVERIKSLVSELAMLLGIDGEGSGTDDLVPAVWFSKQTLITSDQLRGARRRGLIRCERRGARWYYSRNEARRLFSERWLHPRTGCPPRSG